MFSVFYKIYLFYFFVLVLPFLSIASCGGGGSGSSADLNLSAQNCGNALVNENESCDDGNTNNSDGCNTHCAWEVGEAICGNGVLENEECCDDGNNVSGDGCSAACTSERNNRSPSAPILAAEPANGATWAPTRLYLSWNAATDPDAGDRVTYDVYFILKGDRESIPPGILPYKTGISSTHFIIQASTDNRAEYFPDQVAEIYLSPDSHYLWKVCARDSSGAQNCSETRSFNTDNSVVGWWRFDEDLSQPSVCEGEASNSSRKVCDYSGNNNHGVANGSPAWLPSPSNLLGSAIQFDGVDDRVAIGSFNNTGQSNLSITTTVKVNTLPAIGNFYTIVGKEAVAALSARNLEGLYKMTFNVGNGTIWYSQPNPFTSINSLSIGSYDRIASTYDGLIGKIYFNGSLDNSGIVGNAGGLLGTNLITAFIGSAMDGVGQFLNGVVSEVIVYNDLLSDEEIKNDKLSTQ